jgi:hypothetical protein
LRRVTLPPADGPEVFIWGLHVHGGRFYVNAVELEPRQFELADHLKCIDDRLGAVEVQGFTILSKGR